MSDNGQVTITFTLVDHELLPFANDTCCLRSVTVASICSLQDATKRMVEEIQPLFQSQSAEDIQQFKLGQWYRGSKLINEHGERSWTKLKDEMISWLPERELGWNVSRHKDRLKKISVLCYDSRKLFTGPAPLLAKRQHTRSSCG